MEPATVPSTEPFVVAPEGGGADAVAAWAQPAGLRTREVRWADPAATWRTAMSLPGREALERMAAGELPPPPIALLLGYAVTEVGDGVVTFELVPGEHQLNPIGSVHGGVLATLLDSALGCAVHSTLPAGTGYGTTDLQVRYVRAVRADTGRLRARAEVVHRGARLATAEARVTDLDGRLYAHATTACQVFALA